MFLWDPFRYCRPSKAMSATTAFLRLVSSSIPCMHVFCHTCHMPRPSHPPPFDHPNNVWWGVQIMKLNNMQFYPSSCNSSLLGPNPDISLSTLFPNTLSLCSPFDMRDQLSHPYTRKRMAIFLCAFIFTSLKLDSEQETGKIIALCV